MSLNLAPKSTPKNEFWLTVVKNDQLEPLISQWVVLLYNTTAIFLASAELVKSAYLEGNVPQHNIKKFAPIGVFVDR